ncbi:MAG: DUF6427 family protein [Bacteroidales bacterium]|nr:DUF6427 family protein [Bacteroidales bacterium]MDD2322970.1 DUF6427 family protein [Bacteroidales bacterium]MDD3011560.1 DUF6427 family protein [Bacteroidales bacterium]MDY0285932.1 DUF6427 family protein [Bacteroidales bacterium]HPE87060.1 DUF6427 family protein [Bacteroidales bacterium]
MLVRLFKNTYPLQISLVILALIALWMPAFLIPVTPVNDYDKLQPLYNLLIVNNLLNNSLLCSLAAMVLLLAEALFLNRIVNNFQLISKTTFLPALVYILLMSFHPAGLTLHPTLLANLFLLLILNNLFFSNDNQNHYQAVLSIGFYLSVASMFFFPIVLLVPVLLIFVATVSTRPVREIIIYFTGVTLPYYFLAFSYFMLNDLREISHAYIQFLWNFLDFTLHYTLFDLGIMGWLVFLFILSILHISRTLFEMIIANRRKYIFLIFIALALIVGTGFSPDPLQDGIMVVFPSSCILLSKYLSDLRRKKWADFLLWMLIVFIVIAKVRWYA